ncbi:Ig-like domain-containing protein [Pseudomonas fluorescens]|uniref:Ig-like domain-containing protein n=1 Tax=Pseudomonas fluorescens TaxID=294 RepID=UPI00273441EF|nr:Ig-like domain-containing protein [Pseudomonas fluorescens]WLH73168.1 Ig-like domain-containing protein [Pseudomonas fluorescens]
MNANVVNVAVVDGKTITQTVELSSVKNGQPVRIKAVQGGKYILAEGANGIAPENITIKRVGKDLHIALEGSDPDQPQLIIEDFEGTGGQLVGVAEDGSYHEYISSDAEQDRSAAFLIEGVEAPQVLGAQPLSGFGDGLAAAAGIGWFWPALLGLAALGVLGGIYAATRDNDGGNDDAPGAGGGNADKGSIGGVDDNVGDKQGLIENGGSTDDRTPTFTGEGKPGTSVEIVDNGETIGTAIVGEDGKWEYTPPEPGLDDGKHDIVIVPVDENGKKGEPSPEYEIIVDTVAPSRPLIDGIYDDVAPQEGQIGSGGRTNDTTPTLSGTGEAESIIHIYDNGVDIGSVQADNEGKWSFTPDPELVEGPHEFTVVAEDAAGNTSTPSLPFPIIVDLTPPGKPGAGTGGIDDALDNVGADQGSIGNGDSTDDTTPTLIGSGGEPGDIVTIIDNGLEIGTAIVDEDGKWEFTPDPELTEGPHEIVVVITDPAGNESEPSDPHLIIVDTTAPSKPGPGTGGIDDVQDNVGPNQGSIGDGDITDDNTPSIIGSGGEPGDIVTIIDNGLEIGTAIVDEDGKWEFTPDPELTEGPHEIVVVITDPAGNESEPSDPYTIIVDTAAPVAPTLTSVVDDQGAVTGNLTSGDTTDDARPDLSGTAEDGSLVMIYDNGRPIGSVIATGGTWTFTPTVPLSNGPHTITATSTDAAGNVSPPTPGFDLDVAAGGVPPAPAIITVVDDQGAFQGPLAQNDFTDDAQPTINGTGVDGTIITVFANGVPLGTTTVVGGQWSFTPPGPLDEGLNNLVAQATDAAGNLSPSTGDYPINVDTSAPSAPTGQSLTDDVGAITGPIVAGDTTDDANPTFSGMAEAGALVVIYDNGLAIGSTSADPITGAWSFTPAAPLVNGPHSFAAQAVDSAGNTGPMGPAIPFNVDTSGVVISITSVVDNEGTLTGNLTSGQTTDDTTPTLNGQATPGGIVSIYDGTTLLGTVMADATTGQWSFTTPALFAGPHDLTATVTTLAGGESAPTPVFDVIIDTVAPLAPLIGDVADDVGAIQGTVADGGSTDDTTPTLSGSGLQPGDVVMVYDDGLLLGSTSVIGDGSWSYTPTTPLNPGPHPFTVVAVDPAGNASVPSTPWTIEIDTSAPIVPTLTSVVDDQGAVTGNLTSGDTTDDARPDLSGTAEDGSLVTIYDNGRPIGSVIATGGTWTFTPTVPLSNGPHTITATSTDAAGNVSPPTLGFDLDVAAGGVPPAPAIITVVDDQGAFQGPLAQNDFTDDAQPTINGTGADGTIITVFANGVPLGTTTVVGGQWSFTPPGPLDEGLNNLSAQATDAAGNPSPSTGDYPINVDTSAPSAPTGQSLTDDVGAITGPIVAGDTTDDANPTFSGMAEAGALVVIYDNGLAIGSTSADPITGAWSFTPAAPLVNGPHSFAAQAVDSAGNTGPMGPAIPFNVDTSGVVISITSVVDNEGTITGNLTSGQTTDDTTPTLNGQATPGGIVSIYDGATLLGTVMADATTGQWSFTTPVLFAGPHGLTATVTTLAGGESAPTPVFDVIIDTVAPLAPLIGDVADDVGVIQGTVADGGSTDDTTPTLSGSGLQPGDVVMVYDDGLLLGSTSVIGDGSWSYTATPPLNDGPHPFTVVAVDPAGNASAPSAPWTVVIDTAVPFASAVVDSMGKDSGADSGDFVTNDGSAGRLIQGSLTAALAVGEKVQVSTDGGATWLDALMNANGTWSFIDQNSHSSDWTIQTRVVDAAGNANLASQSISLDGSAPDAPDGFAINGTTVTVAFDGSSLAAGDTILLVVGSERFEQTLTQAQIDAGLIDVTTTPGVSMTNTSASFIDQAGNSSQVLTFRVSSVNFESVTPVRVAEMASMDFGAFTFRWDDGSADSAAWPRGVIPAGTLTGEGFLTPSIGLGAWGGTSQDARATLNNGQTATGVTFRIGELTSAMVLRFYDAQGNEVHNQPIAVTGGSGSATISSTLPAGIEFNYFEFDTADGQYFWLDDFVLQGVSGGYEYNDPAVNQTINDAGAYYGDDAENIFSLGNVADLNNVDSFVHGGGGLDTLSMTGTSQVLDLSAIAGKLESIEVIDITGTGNNTLNLSLGDVLEQGETSLFTADETTQMMVKGNAGDVVNLDDLLPDGTDPGDWAASGTATVAGVTYNVFQHSTLDAQLLVQDGVTTNLV